MATIKMRLEPNRGKEAKKIVYIPSSHISFLCSSLKLNCGKRVARSKNSTFSSSSANRLDSIVSQNIYSIRQRDQRET